MGEANSGIEETNVFLLPNRQFFSSDRQFLSFQFWFLDSCNYMLAGRSLALGPTVPCPCSLLSIDYRTIHYLQERSDDSLGSLVSFHYGPIFFNTSGFSINICFPERSEGFGFFFLCFYPFPQTAAVIPVASPRALS